MEEVIADQRLCLCKLMSLVIDKYDDVRTSATKILGNIESKQELDVELLASIMHLLSTLEDRLEEDADIQDLLEELQTINERVMEIAEKMKI